MTTESLRPATDPGTAKAKRTILVVDDDRRVIDLLQISLTQNGYRVLTALTGEEGLEIERGGELDVSRRIAQRNGS